MESSMESSVESSASQPVPATPASQQRSRLLPALLLLVAVALAYRVAHDRAAAHHNDPLHGNLEETPIALDSVLARTPETERLPLLLTYTRDPNPALRYAAIDQLGERAAPQLANPLGERAVSQLADLLELAFQDSDSKVREIGMLQLTRVAPKRGMRLVLCGLRDDDTWMRESAVLQVKTMLQTRPDIANGKIVPNLIAVLDDPDVSVPQTAMNVLRKITGHNWYVKMRAAPALRQAAVAHWKQWWQGARAKWPTDPQYASIAPIAPTRTDPCPDFSLYSLDGHSVSLQGQRNHITLLNFWGRWCGPCIAEAPSLVETDRRYRSRQVDVIGIQVDQGGHSEAQESNEIRNWCRDHGVTYTQAIATSAVREAFGDIHDVPVTVLLDRQGRIRYRWEGGPREPEVFGTAIEHLLKE